MKRCSKCRRSKSGRQFTKDKHQSTGLARWCKQCSREKSRHAYSNNTAAFRARRLQEAYNITLSDYEAMAATQQHRCAICGEAESHVQWGRQYPLAVDHDHTTRRIRALLCGHCNRGLGFFRDNPSLLLKAAAYLQSHIAA